MRTSRLGVPEAECEPSPFVTVLVLVFKDELLLMLGMPGMAGVGVPPRAGLCVPLHGSTSYPLARGSENPLLCMALGRGVSLLLAAEWGEDAQHYVGRRRGVVAVTTASWAMAGQRGQPTRA